MYTKILGYDSIKLGIYTYRQKLEDIKSVIKRRVQMEKNRGITLIVLVITIIVTLILVGIVLNLTVGENRNNN